MLKATKTSIYKTFLSQHER